MSRKSKSGGKESVPLLGLLRMYDEIYLYNQYWYDEEFSQ